MTLSAAKRIGIGFVFLWFFIGGIGHFLATDFFVKIMPDYINKDLYYPAVYISGVFELAFAFLFLSQKFRPAAGIGLIVLTLSVSPANLYMWMHPERFPDVPELLLSLRLVLQVLLIALIWWASRPVAAEQAK